ncbi:hypothetical protein KL867_21995 [Ruegeria litorea]|uniref:CTP synthetase n=1 Tax=Falsiruegeria litorea TaxID=1280831 RepID=A0ABS5WX81_9RHOB|nr:hypothetical protein [Falsiruegeria litorea]MBT3143737.1 hypothetical protein [Falsiruegeria litorea]
MVRLASILFTLISTALAGTRVIIVLAAGYVSVNAILLSAAIGFVAGAPVSWVLAKKLYNDPAG